MRITRGIPPDVATKECMEKFFSLVQDKYYFPGKGGDRCHKWGGKMFHNGYPAFLWDRRVYGAHRVAYYIKYREEPEEILHMCSNRGCVNPDHMIGGSHKLNMRHYHYVEKVEKKEDMYREIIEREMRRGK